MAKDIPYLEDAEECEEIFYDDCVEVTESIPGKPRSLQFSIKCLHTFQWKSARGRELTRSRYSFPAGKSSGKRGRKEERKLAIAQQLKVKCFVTILSIIL